MSEKSDQSLLRLLCGHLVHLVTPHGFTSAVAALALGLVLRSQRRRRGRVQHNQTHYQRQRGKVAIYQKQSVLHPPPHLACGGVNARLTPPGLRPSVAVCQRQYPRFHSPCAAEISSSIQRCAANFLVVCPQRQRLLAAPCLDPRIRPRRCLRYLCQG